MIRRLTIVSRGEPPVAAVLLGRSAGGLWVARAAVPGIPGTLRATAPRPDAAFAALGRWRGCGEAGVLFERLLLEQPEDPEAAIAAAGYVVWSPNLLEKTR